MFRVLVLTILLMVTGVPTALALQIIYPADATYINRSEALVIKAGEGIDGLVIELAGESSDLIDISGEQYRATFKDMLILRPEFDPGENLIKVRGYRQGEKVAEAQIRFFLRTDQLAPPPEGYRRFLMHVPEKEALCVECHDLQPTSRNISHPSPQQNPCVTCHRGMLRPEWSHGPAGAYECGSCHELKNEKGRFRERKIHAALCTECHQDIVEAYMQAKFVHGPVEAGLCNTCHDSHATPHRGQLVASANDLCLGCHEGVDDGAHVGRGVGGRPHPLSGPKDPSRPGRAFDCTGCHNPHGGSARYYYQQGALSRMQLCQVCHRK
jgi:predicted CXXCH cytochrome family protein